MELNESEIAKLDWVKATEIANQNWENWADCFENKGELADLPIIKDRHKYQSFVYEYSVFRGFKRARIEQVFSHLASIQTPSNGNFLEPYTFIQKGFDSTGKKRSVISFSSKLLSLWAPAEYPMWDQYVRNGLRKVAVVPKSKGFHSNKPESYENFREVFFLVRDKLRQRGSAGNYLQEHETRKGFTNRVLDVALMNL
ncbi:hypothetical protein [Thalassovita sp.]|uniref:hypothetical protein n=1 Tax=Thalassovita sp. TaxID=1979401 RepID=UPI0029DE860B|nr:hypothetical protein [Thalassovita sp.]